MKEDINVTGGTVRSTVISPALRRVSWGAIFAGLVIALVMQLLLSLLGVAIGASTIDPLQGETPGKGIAIGAGIWLLVSSLISMYIGACVAAHLSGAVRKSDSVLHGVLTWGAATLVTAFLLTSAVGNLVGGAVGLLGKGVSAAGQAAGGAAANADVSGSVNIDWESIKKEAREVAGVQPTGKTDAQGAQGSQSDSQQGQAASSDPEKNPQLMATLTRMFGRGGAQANPQDREAAINILTTQHGMSRDEATATIQRWEQKFQQTKAEAEQKARQAGDTAARGTAQAAFWSFLILLLGAIAAALGGASGRRSILETTRTEPAGA